ncbi:hypothetical protein B0H19DRAFT_1136315, partial [Mycena capillaripes]
MARPNTVALSATMSLAANATPSPQDFWACFQGWTRFSPGGLANGRHISLDLEGYIWALGIITLSWLHHVTLFFEFAGFTGCWGLNTASSLVTLSWTTTSL